MPAKPTKISMRAAQDILDAITGPGGVIKQEAHAGTGITPQQYIAAAIDAAFAEGVQCERHMAALEKTLKD